MNIDLTSAENKILVIFNKEVLFYDKVEISSGHSVYAAPRSKSNIKNVNRDEVIFLPESFSKEGIGVLFIFSNNQNMKSVTNNETVGLAISNVIYSIREFNYNHISNSIIIKNISDGVFPEQEVKIKGEISNMRWLIEDYVDSIISTYCASVES